MTQYACTYISKEIEEDSFEHGCLYDTRRRIMSESCNIVAASLELLIEDIGNIYGLEIDDVFIPDDENNVEWFSFNRLENNDGGEPSDRELAKWRDGRLPLWLADYNFHIEQRETKPIPIGEFRNLQNIKTH